MIENVTEYNEDVLREIIKPLSKSFRTNQRLFGIAFIVICFVAGFMYEGMTRYGCFVLGIGGYFILMYFASRRLGQNVQALMNGMRNTYNADHYTAHAVIDETKITVDTEKQHRVMQHTDIKRIGETERFYVVQYNNNVYITITKDGFISGTLDDFKKVMNIQ